MRESWIVIPERLKIAVVTALAAALWASIAATQPRPSDPYNIEAAQKRFDELRSALPGRGTFGYIRDPQTPNPAALPLAQYALAPLILVEGDTPPLVVADFYDKPWRFSDVARERGWSVIKRAGAGLYLVSRSRQDDRRDPSAGR